ncbi:hypothetical protein SAMN05192571_11087 [Pleomorphomonas diazotrophica]|nr:hypothetical protein SAMN05192571_11087 [Pleomorphomonas diazotrophica]
MIAQSIQGSNETVETVFFQRRQPEILNPILLSPRHRGQMAREYCVRQYVVRSRISLALGLDPAVSFQNVEDITSQTGVGPKCIYFSLWHR